MKEKINLTSVLLSVIAGLVTFFGSISVNYLGKMNETMSRLVTSDAVQDNKIDAIQKQQDEMKGFYQDVIKSYAKNEEEFDIKRMSK